jgi:hypothetical protein
MATHHNDGTNRAQIGSSETTSRDSAKPTEDRIRQRAYERYQERGGEHGHDTDDWLEAERELEGNADQRSSQLPRNRDQGLPRRTGDSIESTVDSERGQHREGRVSPMT